MGSHSAWISWLASLPARRDSAHDFGGSPAARKTGFAGTQGSQVSYPRLRVHTMTLAQRLPPRKRFRGASLSSPKDLCGGGRERARFGGLFLFSCSEKVLDYGVPKLHTDIYTTTTTTRENPMKKLVRAAEAVLTAIAAIWVATMFALALALSLGPSLLP